MQQIAFVCGVPRSGTTAMATLLNGHPLVCIGMERFHPPLRRLCPPLFEKERFFDFDPGANHRLYRRMAEKWDGAGIIGDKIPLLFKAMPLVRKRFPDAKIIYMLRNIEAVACSWNRRAFDDADTWPAYQSFRPSVLLWNRANRVIARQVRQNPDAILIICYERFFSGDDAELARLCSFLGVEQAAELTAMYRKQIDRYRAEVAMKPAMILPGQEEFIRRHADMQLYRALLNAGPIRRRHLIRSLHPAHWAALSPAQIIGWMRSRAMS